MTMEERVLSLFLELNLFDVDTQNLMKYIAQHQNWVKDAMQMNWNVGTFLLF